jgi:hypothetical protein
MQHPSSTATAAIRQELLEAAAYEYVSAAADGDDAHRDPRLTTEP